MYHYKITCIERYHFELLFLVLRYVTANCAYEPRRETRRIVPYD